MLKIYITTPTGERYDYTNIISDTVKISGSISQLAKTIDFEVPYNNITGLPVDVVDLENGAYIIEIVHNENKYAGIIYESEKNSEGIKYKAQDPCFYLSSKIIIQFNDETIDKAVKLLLEKYKAPVGIIDQCDVKVDEYYYKKSIAETIQEFQKIILEKTGKTYYFNYENGKFNFIKSLKDKYLEGSYEVPEYYFEYNQKQYNIFTAISDPSYSVSFEKMKNSVIVIKGKEKDVQVIEQAKDDENISKYGLLQEIIEREDPKGEKSTKKSSKSGGKKKSNSKKTNNRRRNGKK